MYYISQITDLSIYINVIYMYYISRIMDLSIYIYHELWIYQYILYNLKYTYLSIYKYSINMHCRYISIVSIYICSMYIVDV